MMSSTKRRHIIPFLFAILMSMLFSDVLAQDREVVTIQIMSRPAATLIDGVRSLLGQDSGVSAFHDKLIVNATPRELTAVKALLAELDRPARRLIIEVRDGGNTTMATRSLGYGVNTGDVRIGRTPPGSRGNIDYRDIQTRGSADSLQRVQALDGQPALIRSGQSVPIYQVHQGVVGGTVVQGFDVRYRDSLSGFFALPRVHGDQVTVEIYQQSDRPVGNGYFNIQQASTVLSGGLGQWLTLGSIGGNHGREGDQFGRHAQTRRSQDRLLELRVIAVDR